MTAISARLSSRNVKLVIVFAALLLMLANCRPLPDIWEGPGEAAGRPDAGHGFVAQR